MLLLAMSAKQAGLDRMSRKRALTNLATVAIVCLVGYFFYRAFVENWASLTSQRLEMRYGLLALALAMIVATSLLATAAWQTTVNSLSGKRPLTFTQSFAAVNASGLTKYLPGKLWSYALQMYWLASAGIQKSLVLYVNLLNLGVSLLMSGLTGLALLASASGGTKLAVLLAVVGAVALADLAFIRYHGVALQWMTRLASRALRRPVEYIEFPAALLLKLHALYFAAAVLSAISTFVLCEAIGFPLPLQQFPLITASYLLADVVGFLALVVPGGIGVREGVMYFLLGGASFGPVAVVLPLAMRAAGMIADVTLGGAALLLLRRLNQPDGLAPKQA